MKEQLLDFQMTKERLKNRRHQPNCPESWPKTAPRFSISEYRARGRLWAPRQTSKPSEII